MNFAGQSGNELKGDKNGRLYLTTHRMIFNNKSKGDPMQSFSFPFVALKDVRNNKVCALSEKRFSFNLLSKQMIRKLYLFRWSWSNPSLEQTTSRARSGPSRMENLLGKQNSSSSSNPEGPLISDRQC